MKYRLAGKVALISGGARGQGAAHAELFASEGAKVVIGDVLDSDGRSRAKALADRNLDVLYTHLDVRRSAEWDAAVALAEDRYGSLNVLVNNAGVLSPPTLLDETEEHWAEVIAVNQTGVFLGMKAAIPAMQRAGGGAIVNISSIFGVVGTPDYVAYQASKGAVRQLTRSAALTHAKDGIRVNSVCPGLVLTAMAASGPPEVAAAAAAATPMGRGAEAHEISGGVLYLASDEASYVTGAELAIDGGFLAQ